MEKYRPKRLSDVINQKAAKEALQSFLKNPKNMPHFLFGGPPGTGKTTIAECVAIEIFGSLRRDYVMEMNATSGRLLRYIEQVKEFAAHSFGFGDFPFRLVILDEADKYTSAEHNALRRTMEVGCDNSEIHSDCK